MPGGNIWCERTLLTIDFSARRDGTSHSPMMFPVNSRLRRLVVSKVKPENASRGRPFQAMQLRRSESHRYGDQEPSPGSSARVAALRKHITAGQARFIRPGGDLRATCQPDHMSMRTRLQLRSSARSTSAMADPAGRSRSGQASGARRIRQLKRWRDTSRCNSHLDHHLFVFVWGMTGFAGAGTDAGLPAVTAVDTVRLEAAWTGEPAAARFCRICVAPEVAWASVPPPSLLSL